MTIHSIFFATSRAIPMNKTDLIIHYLKRDLSPTDEHDFKAEYFTIAPIFTSLDFKVMPLVSQVWNNSIYFDWRDLRVWIGHGQVHRILFTSNCKHFLWYLPPTGDANTVGLKFLFQANQLKKQITAHVREMYLACSKQTRPIMQCAILDIL